MQAKSSLDFRDAGIREKGFLMMGDIPPKNFDKPVRPSGVYTPRTMLGPKPLPRAEIIMARDRHHAAAEFSHKREGSWQTHFHASRTREGALVRFYMAGHINADQLADANEIASVTERIQREVGCGIVNYEPRIDRSMNVPTVLIEGIRWVRLEMAYGWWRVRAPKPIAAVLDMLAGDPMAYSTAAKIHRIHKRKARRILIDAIDLWPNAKDWAERQVDEADLHAAAAGLLA